MTDSVANQPRIWQQTEMLLTAGLWVSGKLYIGYAAGGGPLLLVSDEPVPLAYRVIDPRTGTIVDQGLPRHGSEMIPDTGGEPRVYICCDGW